MLALRRVLRPDARRLDRRTGCGRRSSSAAPRSRSSGPSCSLARASRPTGLRAHWPALVAIGFLDTGGNALFAAPRRARPAQRRLGARVALPGGDGAARAVRARRAGAAHAGRRRARRARRRRPDHSGRLETRCSITARSSRTSSRQSPAGSGRFQSTYSLPGRTGHASPQPIVTTRSAHSTSVALERLRHAAGDVDPDLLERLDDRLVELGGRPRAGRPRLAAPPLVERLRDLRAARVLDADEEDAFIRRAYAAARAPRRARAGSTPTCRGGSTRRARRRAAPSGGGRSWAARARRPR